MEDEFSVAAGPIQRPGRSPGPGTRKGTRPGQRKILPRSRLLKRSFIKRKFEIENSKFYFIRDLFAGSSFSRKNSFVIIYIFIDFNIDNEELWLSMSCNRVSKTFSDVCNSNENIHRRVRSKFENLDIHEISKCIASCVAVRRRYAT